MHGMKLDKAKSAFERFLGQTSHTPGQYCVRIIHGKGLGSKDGVPVLKLSVQQWLQCNKNVLAYCSCRPSDGGPGAVYVLVKGK